MIAAALVARIIVFARWIKTRLPTPATRPVRKLTGGKKGDGCYDGIASYLQLKLAICRLVHLFETLVIQMDAKSVVQGVMKISRKSRLALKALLELTRLSDRQYMSLTEISEKHFVSKSYLEHLFVLLRRQGLVRGMRGMGGGYRLARPASQISVADIVFAAEDLLPVPDASTASGARDAVWFELTRQIYEFLDGISLADFSFPSVKAGDPYFRPAERLSGTHG